MKKKTSKPELTEAKAKVNVEADVIFLAAGRKRIPEELKYHKQYPIYKSDAREGIAVILNEKEAIVIQSNGWGEGDGFKFRHYRTRKKVLDILKGKTISAEQWKIDTSKFIGSYLKPLLQLQEGINQKLLEG